MRIGATTLVSSWARTSSSETSSTAPDWANPALLTTAHGPPSVMVAICSNPSRVESASSTESSTVRTVTPRSPAACSTSAAFSALRTVPITS